MQNVSPSKVSHIGLKVVIIVYKLGVKGCLCECVWLFLTMCTLCQSCLHAAAHGREGEGEARKSSTDQRETEAKAAGVSLVQFLGFCLTIFLDGNTKSGEESELE